MIERQKILIVDDQKQNLVALRQVLRGMDAELIEASSGNEALTATLHHHFAVAILDVMMPVMNGYELAEVLRGDDKTKEIPIIFLTAADVDDLLVFRGYDAGAVDYIVKPCAPEVLRGKLNVFLELDRNRRELQRNLESYRTLIEQSPVAILVMTPDGRVAQINDAYEQLWAVELSDLHEYNIFQDERLKELDLMPYIERAFAGENVTLPLAEYRIRPLGNDSDDATRWIQANLYCVKNDRGELLNVVMMQSDVSERKRLEARLERKRKQHEREVINRKLAEEANQAKSAFLATMSHELRTPLNAIIGFSEMLLEQVNRHSLDEYQQDRLTRVGDAGNRLLTLVNDILDIARVESGKLQIETELFDPGAVIREVSGLAEALAGKKPDTQFRLELESGLPQVSSDPKKVCQILVNLVGNAFRFTERGTVTLRCWRSDNCLLMSVEDTGVGIAAEQLEQIFEKFYQVEQSRHRSLKGTGLGLAVCRAFSDLLAGTLTVQSVVGQGSTFTLALPDVFDGPLTSTSGDQPQPVC